MPIRKTNKEFIQECKRKFCNKFSYEKTKYINSTTKVTITCKKHGDFEILPWAFLKSKYGCQLCAKSHRNDKKRYTTEGFIESAKKIHGNKYDYSKTVYNGSHNNKVIITCPEHGDFMQTPKNHLCGHGCPICAGIKNNNKTFIEKSIKKHGEKYGYENVVYRDLLHKVLITCPIHGDVLISPASHLNGVGCPECGRELRAFETRKNTDFFIKKAKEIHGNKYDYSKTVYRTRREDVLIICPEHGEFWQKAGTHLSGHGCPKCKTSKMEKRVIELLNEIGVDYFYNKNLEWMQNLRLDFYIPSKKIAIECQGKQHFQPVDFAGHGEEDAKIEFEKILERDRRKKELCEKNNVKLIYLTKKDNIKEIIKNII